MIQRIQTVYMFLTFVVSGVLSLFLPLWKDANGNDVMAPQEMLYVFIFGASAALSIISIMSYKKDNLNLFTTD